MGEAALPLQDVEGLIERLEKGILKVPANLHWSAHVNVEGTEALMRDAASALRALLASKQP